MQKTTTIIYFDVANIRRYIQEHSLRPDGRLVPLTTEKIEEAFEYDSEEYAKDCIKMFINLSHRQYKTATRSKKVNGHSPTYTIDDATDLK
jgi:hypothetical protein